MGLGRGNIRGEVLYFWRIITQYGACAAWSPASSRAGSLISAASLVCGFWVGVFLHAHHLPHAVPNAHHPTKIRAISYKNKSDFLVRTESFAHPGALCPDMRMHLWEPLQMLPQVKTCFIIYCYLFIII